jgi:hypothetical protein
MLGDFASRLCGSADIYGGRGEGRRPSASVNFVTVHDGFTLADLVSYNGKHNEANGEGNRDGTDDNRSWNCGREGPTTDPDVLALRARQQRAFLATLLLSAGVPSCWAATRPAAPSGATTMRTARTTTSPGSTGRRSTVTCCGSQRISSSCADVIGRSDGGASSPAPPLRTCAGSPCRGQKWPIRIGPILWRGASPFG